MSIIKLIALLILISWSIQQKNPLSNQKKFNGRSRKKFNNRSRKKFMVDPEKNPFCRSRKNIADPEKKLHRRSKSSLELCNPRLCHTFHLTLPSLSLYPGKQNGLQDLDHPTPTLCCVPHHIYHMSPYVLHTRGSCGSRFVIPEQFTVKAHPALFEEGESK